MMRQVLLLSTVLAFGCNDQQFHSLQNVPQWGELSLSGRLCHPETKVWLKGATVYTHLIDENGDLWGTLDTVADDEGFFTLDRMEAGQDYQVYVQWGNELVQKLDVTMPDTDYTMPNPDCGSFSGLSAAVVTGDFDDFTEVLPLLGIEAWDTVEGTSTDQLSQFLANGDALLEYDVIFFPGGHVEEGVFYTNGGASASRPI